MLLYLSTGAGVIAGKGLGVSRFPEHLPAEQMYPDGPQELNNMLMTSLQWPVAGSPARLEGGSPCP